MKKELNVFLGGILSFIDGWVSHLLFFLFALVLPFRF
jgi:hypothetical protein